MSKILLGNIKVNGVLSDMLIEGDTIRNIRPVGVNSGVDSEHSPETEYCSNFK